MSRWLETTLGEACELYQPKTISSAELVADGKYPVYGANGVIGKFDKFNHAEPQLLITCRGATCGSVNVSQPNSWINGNAMVVKPRGISVDLDYLKHLFQGGLDLTAVITGAAQPQITRQSLAPLKVRFPSILEQRRIAAILDQADALRVKRREALAQFDSLIRSIFIEMFGDPETNTKGFETTKFSALCKRVTDGTHQSPTWSAVGHPFLFVSNIVSGEIDFDTKKFISEETHDELTRRCPIEVGDVLYSTVGSYGVPVVVRTSRKFAFQRHIAHIKPNPDLLDSEFLCAMLDSPSLRKQADRVARGVAQKTVNLSDIGNFLVFKPPLKLQQEFANRAAMAASLKTANLASFAELDALFASLQHRAFRGEL